MQTLGGMKLTRGEWAFLASWLLGLAVLAISGNQIDGYQLHVQRVPLPHPYPWRGIAVMVGVLSTEVLLFYAIIRPRSYDHSWLRALSALLVSLGLALFFGAQLMHAPPFMVWHWLVLACAVVSFLVLLSASVVGARRRHAA